MTENQLFTYTNAVLAADMLANYMEELKGTVHYKQSFKHRCKLLSTDLESILNKELPKLYSVDEEFTVNCMNQMKGLVENISSSSVDDLIVISQLISEYKQDKEKFLSKHEITLKRLD